MEIKSSTELLEKAEKIALFLGTRRVECSSLSYGINPTGFKWRATAGNYGGRALYEDAPSPEDALNGLIIKMEPLVLEKVSRLNKELDAIQETMSF